MTGCDGRVTSLGSPWSRRASLKAALGALSVVLTGCGHGSDQVEADLDIPVAYRASATAANAMWPAEDWWTGFGSPTLNSLIEQARRGNFDIAAAIARVRQADAQVRIAGSAL